MESAQATLDAVKAAASKWPRCCDLWQDGFGTMHCHECEQKTFAMLYEIQKILRIRKDGVCIPS